MAEKKKVSKAQMRATAKWEAENYDHVHLRLPKGTKDRITALGQSVNGYAVRAIIEALERDENA